MMAHAKSAMTHILEDIRLDGVKFLDVFMENHAALVLRHSERIIPNQGVQILRGIDEGSSNKSIFFHT